MLVHPNDGRCRECRTGILKIIDTDDVTMTVVCKNPACRETYLVELDAFGDGCMKYYPAFKAKQLGRRRRRAALSRSRPRLPRRLQAVPWQIKRNLWTGRSV